METTLRINSARVGSSFVAEVERLSGQKLLACYQCGKCSAGCPMAAHMDILPNQLIRMAQLGMREQLLASKSIWMCVSCLTCNSRCPDSKSAVCPSRTVTKPGNKVVRITFRRHFQFTAVPRAP